MSPPSEPRPVVGITSSDHDARWGPWQTRATLVPTAYVRAVEDAGGYPVLLVPPAGPDGAEEEAASVAARLDGVLLSGGADVDPRRYGAEPHPQSQEPDQARDAFEVALLSSCAERATPVLAVCRGMQLLNVARGGTLLQHLPDAVGHAVHMPSPGRYAAHPVAVVAGSSLARALGRLDPVVPGHHHQGVDEVGRGLVVSARAADGVIEGLEDTAAAFLVGVQWHPEV
ncbi:MAG: gamma-glutamyl-gamma-aminobutyrate hydrolase family protein, partial [Acidimicrobiales bacterium]